MNEVEDAQLLERSRRGDEGAFAELFRRYQAAIYRYAVHMCGTSAGDDVVQETFLAVLRQRGRTDAPRQAVAGYLFGIAQHIVLQRLGAANRGAAGQRTQDRHDDSRRTDRQRSADRDHRRAVGIH